MDFQSKEAWNHIFLLDYFFFVIYFNRRRVYGILSVRPHVYLPLPNNFETNWRVSLTFANVLKIQHVANGDRIRAAVMTATRRKQREQFQRFTAP